LSQVNTNMGGTSGGDPFGTTPSPRRAVTVSLGTPSVPSASRSNAVAEPAPEGFYVIIGRGAAGIVNLTTLLQSEAGKKRMEHPTQPGVTLRVKFYGLHDPWLHYHPHGMGQPPHLLCLPGFKDKPEPGAKTIRSGMHSGEFSAITEGQAVLCRERIKYLGLYAWVPIIQARGKPGSDFHAIVDQMGTEGFAEVAALKSMLDRPFPADAPAYRIVVVKADQSCEFTYAHKIDLCTGMGRANPDEGKVKNPEGRTQLWRPGHEWDDKTRQRVVLTGPEALLYITRWKATDRVCVYFSGGIALNMVERAHDVGCYIDWYPNAAAGISQTTGLPYSKTLHRAFNLPRNDTVLRHASGRAMNPNESGVRNDALATANEHIEIVPASKHWRFGDGTILATTLPSGPGHARTIQITATDAYNPPPQPSSTTVASSSAPAKSSFMLDFDRKSSPLDPNGVFPYSKWYSDQHAKLASDKPDPKVYDRLCMCAGFVYRGTPGVPRTMFPGDLVAIKYQERVVGLQSADGAIRMLGAASSMDPERPKMVTKETKDFFDALPYSAVPPGFIYSAVTIAEANGWFDADHPNLNINTMAPADLIAYLTGNGLSTPDAEHLTKQIVRQRRFGNGLISPTWREAYERTGGLYPDASGLTSTNGVIFDPAKFTYPSSEPGATGHVARWNKAIEGLLFDYGPSRAWVAPAVE